MVERDERPTALELERLRWGFLGAGKMASALIGGLVRAGMAQPERICASDPSTAALEAVLESSPIRATSSNREVVESSDVLVLAVKPQVMPALLTEISPLVGAHHLVISVAAGITLETLAAGLGPDCRLVRVMPNTPALIGSGAAAYSLGPNAGASDAAIVGACLTAVGRVYAVPERLLDAVTGLAGSGPAFVYAMIEALADGGVRVGLPRDVALGLAAQTVAGAARMVMETGLHPGVLKDQVASPGGTTIAGLHALETGGVRGALMDAVVAATRRAEELAGESARKAWPS